MSELLSKINTNTGLIFSLKDQIDVSNAFFQQEITDLQNEKYDKTGGLISGNVVLSNTSISAVSEIQFQENIILRGAKVAIGNLAGQNNQGANAVAVGNFSGQLSQTNNAVAIGINAGNSGQSDSCVGIGNLAGSNQQGQRSVAIGRVAGRQIQGQSSVAVGSSAGSINQGQLAVAIGPESGETGQSNNSIAIGGRAGRTSLGFQSIAIGTNSGSNASQQRTINIGENAGSNASQGYSISLGAISGQNNQGENAIAIGRVAGQTNQGANTIAMGFLAGLTNQGANAIAIGERAGQSNQDNNSIVMNATGVGLNTDASAFYVAPVREKTGTHILQYDNSNKEICFSNTINISDNLEINTPILNIQATQSIEQTIGTTDTYNLEMKIVGIDGQATFNRFPVLSVKPSETEGIQIGIDNNFINNIVRGIGGNPLKITRNEASEETDYIEVGTGVANIVMTENITLQTETLTLTGAGLQGASAGANSGQHLRINLNGTFYKIALLDDI